MVLEENRLLGTLRLLTYGDGISHAVASGDAEKLRTLALPLVVNAREEAVEFLDAQGVTLLSMRHRPGGMLEDYEYIRGDDYFKELEFVRQIVKASPDILGDKYISLVAINNRQFLYVSGHLYGAGANWLGWCLSAKLSSLVQQAREATLAHVTIYDLSGRLVATTLLETQPLDTYTAAQVSANQDQCSQGF